MNILFIHQGLPGQFLHLMRHYARGDSHAVVGIRSGEHPWTAGDLDGKVRVADYQLRRQPTAGIHHYLATTEAAVMRGQAVAESVAQLQRQGVEPDIVLAHTGWGEALYVKDVLPDVPLVGYFEFFYRSRGLDVGFDPEFPVSKDDELRLRTRNAVHLLSLDACDFGVTPTQWQLQSHPAAYQNKIKIVHEGVDTDVVKPNGKATFVLPNGRTLGADDEVITYSSRSLEPYRGFHRLVRALPTLCQRRPKAQVVIVGDDEVSYGNAPAGGGTWRDRLLQEVQIDRDRVHFVGALAWEQYVSLLQVSTVHVYLTVPFVLSWSLIEAMSAGAAIVGSDTAPVREVIEHDENGLLVDFFSAEELVEAIATVCADAKLRKRLADRARQTVIERFDLRASLQSYDRYFTDIVQGFR